MLAVANQWLMVNGDCSDDGLNKTMECCGEEQKKCPDFIHECRRMGEDERTGYPWYQCHIQEGWLILLIIVCWLIVSGVWFLIDDYCKKQNRLQSRSGSRQVRAL